MRFNRWPIVKRHVILIGRAAGHGAFKGAALVGAFAILVAARWWDASLLSAAADANFQLIKIVSGKLPFDWGSKVEARWGSLAPIAPSCSSKASPSPKGSSSASLSLSAAAGGRKKTPCATFPKSCWHPAYSGAEAVDIFLLNFSKTD